MEILKKKQQFSTQMMKITVNNEQKYFERLRDRVPNISRDFSVEMKAGEKLLVTGSNGSGKSSLLAAIAIAFGYSNKTVDNYWSMGCIDSLGSCCNVFYFDFQLFDPRTFYRTSQSRGIYDRFHRPGSHRQVIDEELERRINAMGKKEGRIVFFDEPEIGMDCKRQMSIRQWVDEKVRKKDIGIIATNCRYLISSDLQRLDLDENPVRIIKIHKPDYLLANV